MPRHLLLLFLALFLAMIGFGLTLPVLPAFVERLALGRAATPGRVALHVGALTSTYALAQLVLAPLWGGWSDRHGRKALVVLGLVGVALSHVAFGLGALPLHIGCSPKTIFILIEIPFDGQAQRTVVIIAVRTNVDPILIRIEPPCFMLV